MAAAYGRHVFDKQPHLENVFYIIHKSQCMKTIDVTYTAWGLD